MPAVVVAATIGTAGAAAPGEAAGQLRYGADLALVSRYEWRGVTRGSGWSLHPDVRVSLGAGPRIAAGVWGNVQLADRDPVQGLGFERLLYGEVSPWAEVSGVIGPLEAAGGWSGYFFDAEGAVSPAGVVAPPPVGAPGQGLVDTHEVYGRVRLLSLPVVLPSVAYHLDVDAVRGGYLEPAVALRLPLWPQAVLPLGSLYASARVGISLGQELDGSDPGAAAHFAERGITHWDLSLSLPMLPALSAGPLELAPVFETHLQLNRDPIGRIKRLDGDPDGATWWLRLGFSAAGPRCRPGREVCRR